ncbi:MULTISPECIES: aminotransferase class V-fold PLP-dependent enzyme [unclassified Streptomyces]|uniref:aminotransferase class V-fold PLP-dependent enzyme n=1 Tax=unclassified Streptomyces TaxID=2593676 RepID=UPI000BACB20C|nr:MULTISPECIES: aminotransferase class V-fold PLP-dependent enzyme [unclassified Streptomyces]ASY36350.1 aminotransferase [Streptomyces sp. CLI2509]MYX25040.1 aminotransferase class V-fold PLP-dependent enzyme [Streptomyces sp. SID8380]
MTTQAQKPGTSGSEATGAPGPADFALDPEVRHLNHGSFGTVPRPVLDRLAALRAEMESNPDAWWRTLTGRIAAARAEVAAFLRTAPDSLAFVPNASAGASTVLASLRFTRGARILMTDHTYGAVAMGARRVAALHGAVVDTVHVPLDASTEHIRSLFARELGSGAPVELVVVDQITSPTARLFPLPEIVAEAHAAGARVLVDGAHAPGLLADPLGHASGADYWTGNLHKWVCGPRGTAALVAAEDVAQDLVPLVNSWGAPNPYPHRFDEQGTQDVTGWLAVPGSLAFFAERGGWDAARATMDRTVTAAQALLAEALHADLSGVTVNEALAMRLIPLAPVLATDPDRAAALQRRVAAELRCEVSITSWDGRGFLRLSAHVYNRPEEYEYLAERLPALLTAAAREAA